MNWRLIEEGAHSGAYNMAVDEALLNAQNASDSLPTLRFYDWQPSCLSLGRFQKIPEHLRTETSTIAPVDWVRRPTGGRGVWHQRGYEITYSVTFVLDILPPDQTSVTASYRWISRGLLAGLQTLGIGAQLSDAHAEFGAQNRSASTCKTAKTENCFLSAAQCDTIVDGRKLIGAAQCRKTRSPRVSVLQHGSILLDLDVMHWQRALGEKPLGNKNSQNSDLAWRNRVTTLHELGFRGTRADVTNALRAGMEQFCGARFEASKLTKCEAEAAECLERTKYDALSWNVWGTEEIAPVGGDNFAS